MMFAIKAASLFNPKAQQAVQGRKNWRQKIKDALQNNTQDVIWFHISSLGEFEQARPLITQIKLQYPNYKILLTFFSPSGYNAQKNFQYADFVFYFPFDTKQNAKDFLDIVNPKIICFVKYEFWLNFLFEIKKRKQTRDIKCFLVSSIFRRHQPFFKWYGSLFRNALTAFDVIFVQDNLSVRLLKKIGIAQQVILSGDTRIDRVIEISKQEFSSAEIEAFAQSHKTIICGSTWHQDEKILIPVLKKFVSQQIKIIIAPHQPDEKNVQQLIALLNKHQLTYCRYTKVKESTDAQFARTQVMIIDTIGVLNKIYRYGYFAYIGGGFSDGIHNILEPAVYGLPVVFGKKYHKFYEATELIKMKGAFAVYNANDLENIFQKLSEHSDFYSEAKKSVIQFISEHKGGVENTMNVMSNYLNQTSKN